MRDESTFELYCGSMYSGKTTRVLLEAQNHIYMGRRLIAYKPQLDDRYSKNEITTHNAALSLPAVLVETGDDLVKHLLDLDDVIPRKTTIVADEVFMIKGAGAALVWLYRNGFSILVSSLDMSSSLEPFDEIADIMPWATKIEKCVAVCQVCKQGARFTWRKPGASLDEILVGGVETYEARCSNCHPYFKVE